MPRSQALPLPIGSLRLAWLVAFWLVLAGAALAQPDFRPLPGQADLRGDFTATEYGGRSAGTYALGSRTVRVELTGLKAGGVYSVRLVRDRPFEMRALGAGFTAEADGSARFVAVLPAGDPGSWPLLLIAFHPGGDARDSRDVKPVLRARLKK